MATGGSEVMSDEILNIKCSVCVKKGLSREAEKYCIECQDYYCASCVDMHTLFPSMAGHKLLDKASFRTLGPDSSLPSIPTQRCSQHPFKVTDMFCQDHDEIICTSCVALSHRSCTHIHSIPDDIDNLFNREEQTNIKQKINQVKTSMQEIKKLKQDKLQELKKVFQNEVKSVKAFQQELEELLDNLEQVTIKELKKEFDNIEKCIEADIKEADAIIKAINDIVSEMKKSEGNKAQEFVCMKSSHKLTDEGKKLQTSQRTKQDTIVSFTADHKITAFLKEISIFGTASTITNKLLEPKNSLYTINSKLEINVLHSSEKSTDRYQIFGSCITEDGYLLLTEYFNMWIKRIDMTKKTEIDFVDLKASPIGVCLVSKTEVAVSLDNNSIQFVCLGKKMSTTSTLTMNHPCYGLAYIDGTLFVSDQNKTVYIYNQKGQELCKIEKDSSGKDIFQYTRHIAVSGDGKKVFVAGNNKGLIILDIHGKHLSTVTDPIVSTIQGVCTDGKNVFVCGFHSQNIVQFGEDLKMLGQIEELTAGDPLSICFDKTKSMLFVTYSNSKVTVLELK